MYYFYSVEYNTMRLYKQEKYGIYKDIEGLNALYYKAKKELYNIIYYCMLVNTKYINFCISRFL